MSASRCELLPRRMLPLCLNHYNNVLDIIVLKEPAIQRVVESLECFGSLSGCLGHERAERASYNKLLTGYTQVINRLLERFMVVFTCVSPIK